MYDTKSLTTFLLSISTQHILLWIHIDVPLTVCYVHILLLQSSRASANLNFAAILKCKSARSPLVLAFMHGSCPFSPTANCIKPQSTQLAVRMATSSHNCQLCASFAAPHMKGVIQHIGLVQWTSWRWRRRWTRRCIYSSARQKHSSTFAESPWNSQNISIITE